MCKSVRSIIEDKNSYRSPRSNHSINSLALLFSGVNGCGGAENGGLNKTHTLARCQRSNERIFRWRPKEKRPTKQPRVSLWTHIFCLPFTHAFLVGHLKHRLRATVLPPPPFRPHHARRPHPPKTSPHTRPPRRHFWPETCFSKVLGKIMFLLNYFPDELDAHRTAHVPYTTMKRVSYISFGCAGN